MIQLHISPYSKNYCVISYRMPVLKNINVLCIIYFKKKRGMVKMQIAGADQIQILFSLQEKKKTVLSCTAQAIK